MHPKEAISSSGDILLIRATYVRFRYLEYVSPFIPRL